MICAPTSSSLITHPNRPFLFCKSLPPLQHLSSLISLWLLDYIPVVPSEHNLPPHLGLFVPSFLDVDGVIGGLVVSSLDVILCQGLHGKVFFQVRRSHPQFHRYTFGMLEL